MISALTGPNRLKTWSQCEGSEQPSARLAPRRLRSGDDVAGLDPLLASTSRRTSGAHAQTDTGSNAMMGIVAKLRDKQENNACASPPSYFSPLPAPWPDGGPESLRSPCCGLAIYKKLKHLIVRQPEHEKKTPNLDLGLRGYLRVLWNMKS
ncbi:hypothetical protein PoB_007241700 [Plakobranchus ocellatus]|uniref:Uncharacterized protein n=1 Tax=Plakobranchus ocellatus TaxID=259542 RepID=A0AAV4DNR7_9GAST|nr:hypothetical protein PoB_007241700 [Plakobranchus ocellatus]